MIAVTYFMEGSELTEVTSEKDWVFVWISADIKINVLSSVCL